MNEHNTNYVELPVYNIFFNLTNGIIICDEIENYVELKFYTYPDKTKWKDSNICQVWVKWNN